MRKILLLLFFAIPLFCSSQVNNDIVIGKSYKTYSKELGEERAYFV